MTKLGFRQVGNRQRGLERVRHKDVPMRSATPRASASVTSFSSKPLAAHAVRRGTALSPGDVRRSVRWRACGL